MPGLDFLIIWSIFTGGALWHGEYQYKRDMVSSKFRNCLEAATLKATELDSAAHEISLLKNTLIASKNSFELDEALKSDMIVSVIRPESNTKLSLQKKHRHNGRIKEYHSFIKNDLPGLLDNVWRNTQEHQDQIRVYEDLLVASNHINKIDADRLHECPKNVRGEYEKSTKLNCNMAHGLQVFLTSHQAQYEKARQEEMRKHELAAEEARQNTLKQEALNKKKQQEEDEKKKQQLANNNLVVIEHSVSKVEQQQPAQKQNLPQPNPKNSHQVTQAAPSSKMQNKDQSEVKNVYGKYWNLSGEGDDYPGGATR